MRLSNPAGVTLGQSTGTPTNGVWRAADWQPGDVIVDRQRVQVPAGTASVSATLSVGLSDAAGRPLLVAGQRDSLLPVGHVEVKGRPRAAAPATISHPQSTTFQAPIELMGYDVAPAAARPGETIHLTLYWRADQPVTQSWTVFTHLLDGGEKIRAQQDGIPDQGRRPTTTWAPGEVIADSHRLQVDPTAPGGVDRLEIGLYDPTTGRRLRATNGDDRILLDLPVQVRG